MKHAIFKFISGKQTRKGTKIEGLWEYTDSVSSKAVVQWCGIEVFSPNTCWIGCQVAVMKSRGPLSLPPDLAKGVADVFGREWK